MLQSIFAHKNDSNNKSNSSYMLRVIHQLMKIQDNAKMSSNKDNTVCSSRLYCHVCTKAVMNVHKRSVPCKWCIMKCIVNFAIYFSASHLRLLYKRVRYFLHCRIQKSNLARMTLVLLTAATICKNKSSFCLRCMMRCTVSFTPFTPTWQITSNK